MKDTMRTSLLILGIIGLVMAGSARAQSSNCPSDYAGFLAPRLEVGQRGIVIPGGSGNRLRFSPDARAEQIGTLPPGTEFDIVDGPQCDSAASIVWWKVVTADDMQGWTAEGLLPDDYFLAPLGISAPTATATVTPSPYPTLPPTPTPTAVSLPPLDLPDREVLSPDNFQNIQVIGQFPSTASTGTLFLSPDMNYLFVVSAGAFRSKHTNVYTFPGLQPITQGLPLDGASGKEVGGGRPDDLFAEAGRLLVSVDFHDEDILFYRPGDGSFTLDSQSFRFLRVADLNAAGILAVGFSILGTGNSQPFLCLIDHSGDTYAPGDRLCLPQETGIEALTFLPDDLRLLAGSKNGLTLVDVRSGKTLQTFPYTMVSGGALAVLPGASDGLPTVLVSKEGFILSINLETGDQRTYPSGEGQVANRIILNADGSQIMVIMPTTNIPQVLIMDVAAKAVLHQNVLYGGEDAAYSPDGKLAFINNEIYNAHSWQLLSKLRGDQHIITFSPDGTMLFVWNTSSHLFEIFGVAR